MGGGKPFLFLTKTRQVDDKISSVQQNPKLSEESPLPPRLPVAALAALPSPHPAALPDDLHVLLEGPAVRAEEADLPHLGLLGHALGRAVPSGVDGDALGHLVGPLRPAAVAVDEVVVELLLAALLAALAAVAVPARGGVISLEAGVAVALWKLLVLFR